VVGVTTPAVQPTDRSADLSHAGYPGILALIEYDAATGHATGHRLVDPTEPHVNVTDLAATRGDGVFESVSVTDGRTQALLPHLERFAASAAMLDLPAPDPAIWSAAVTEVATLLHEATGASESLVKTVMSRGVEGGRVPTGWAYAFVSPDFTAARRDGIRVVLLDRGYPHDVASTSPWLLAGAKTLSYAVNRAVVREAARRGADDVVFTSSDGYLLEGAVSNLLIRRGDELVTPRTDIGILTGTTQADLFTWAEEAGWRIGYEMLTPADLASADAAWLVSSGRHVAPIRAVDGVERAIDAELTAAMNQFLHDRES
jgi:4-amino-4-deoxychorismate lyase